MFWFLEYFFKLFYCCFGYKIKSRRRLLKTMAIFLNFVVKTALIWLVLTGFFCVFSQSETICNLYSCYKFCTRVTSFALVLQKNCTPFSANQNLVIFSCILLQCEHSLRQVCMYTCKSSSSDGISSAVSLFSVVALLNKLCSEIFRVK